MIGRKYSTSAFACVMFLATALHADILHVPGDFPTIQAAIDAAMGGDEVEVHPGTYFETINFLAKAIRVYSTNGPDVTIIDGTGLNNSVVKCISGEGADTVLEGFTITNGTGDPSVNPGSTVGGGMRIQDSSPWIEDCIFDSNTAQGVAPLSGDGGGDAPRIVKTVRGPVHLRNHLVLVNC